MNKTSSMAKVSDLNLTTLYKLPWLKKNNPNGWIEPTTYCQLACPGCYRGLAFSNPVRIHEDIIKLKKDIDTLIKIRKIKILTIAGGEPLLRLPDLGALQVAYLQGHFLDAGSDEGQGEEVFGVPVPLNYLGGNRGGV